jgi:hypothetical protein
MSVCQVATYLPLSVSSRICRPGLLTGTATVIAKTPRRCIPQMNHFSLYSPECVEGFFCELRPNGVLGSSAALKYLGEGSPGGAR